MGHLIKQSSAAQPLLFLMIDSSDHIGAKTGLSPTVTLSKNGGAFAAPAGAVSELANGWYKVAGSASDTNTLGPLILHATAPGADPADDRYEVVAFDPQSASNLGLTALPASGTLAVNPTLAASQAFNNTGQTAKLAATIAAGDLAADSITAASIKADAVAKIQNGLAPAATALSNDTWTDAKAAFLDAAVSRVSGGGAAVDEIATAVRARLNAEPIDVNIATVRGAVPVPIAKPPVSLDAADVRGNLPSDLRAVLGGTPTLETGDVGVNVTKWAGQPVATPAVEGVPKVDLAYVNAGVASLEAGDVDVNVTRWGGQPIATPAVGGVPKVDLSYVNGSNAMTSDGTAQAGTATTITLAAGASATDNLYRNRKVGIVSGTGAGQERYITAYVGATRVATVNAAWVTVPDKTSVYQLGDTADVNAVATLGATAPAGWINSATFAPGTTVPRVALTDSLTTYIGNTPQSGDAFARIGEKGAGLTGLAPASTALSNAVWTDARAAYLDAAISSIRQSGGSGGGVGGITTAEIWSYPNRSLTAGVDLLPTGLDAIPITPPKGVASTFREMVVQTWRRFFKRTTMSSRELRTYADDNSTVVTTQVVSDDNVEQMQGAAS